MGVQLGGEMVSSLGTRAERGPRFKPYAVVVQLLSRVPLCDPMDHSTPGLPVLHQLLEFSQTHVH